MRVVYLHGLGGKNTGSKVDFLNNQFDNVFCPQIDYDNFDFDKLFTQIKNFNPDLIIGSSMGGWVSFNICRLLNIKCLIFNPALQGRSKDIYVNETGRYNPRIRIVFGKFDRVISSRKSINFLLRKNIKFSKVIEKIEHRIPTDIFIKYVSIEKGDN